MLQNSQMSFNEIVKEAVGPILISSGFTVIYETEGSVEYKNNVLSVRFSYDRRRSYEVDIGILFKANGESYTYPDLKEYFYQIKDNYMATQIVHENHLVLWMDGVRHFLEENLQYILEHHLKVCIELAGLRSEKNKQYQKEREERYLENQVESLWRAKDYAGLVKVFEEYRGEIEGSLKMKYQYALKMVKRK